MYTNIEIFQIIILSVQTNVLKNTTTSFLIKKVTKKHATYRS